MEIVPRPARTGKATRRGARATSDGVSASSIAACPAIITGRLETRRTKASVHVGIDGDVVVTDRFDPPRIKEFLGSLAGALMPEYREIVGYIEQDLFNLPPDDVAVPRASEDDTCVDRRLTATQRGARRPRAPRWVAVKRANANRERYSLCRGERPMGSNRVIRGGSWNNDARNCRSAYRNRNWPENRNQNLGFRLARSSADGVDSLPDGTGRFPMPPRAAETRPGPSCVTSRKRSAARWTRARTSCVSTITAAIRTIR